MNKRTIMYDLKSIDNEVFKKLGNRFKQIDSSINPIQGKIIGSIYNSNEEVLYQKDIESFVLCNKSTLSSVLDTMEKNDLIKRVDSELDSRKKIITLTEKSKNIAKTIEQENKVFDEVLAKNITDEEYEVFKNVINKIRENIRKEED